MVHLVVHHYSSCDVILNCMLYLSSTFFTWAEALIYDSCPTSGRHESKIKTLHSIILIRYVTICFRIIGTEVCFENGNSILKKKTSNIFWNQLFRMELLSKNLFNLLYVKVNICLVHIYAILLRNKALTGSSIELIVCSTLK